MTRPGLRNRTIVASSIGKTFSLTGWKVGWTIAPPHLSAAVRASHQFMIFSVATPLQVAAAKALNAPPKYFSEFREEYSRKRELLLEGLESAGLNVIEPQGTYFALIDHTSYGLPDDRTFCQHLIDEVGVAAIPVSAFHHDGDTPGGGGRNLVRFAFCKTELVLKQAITQLRRLNAGGH
jgi:aspartate/methionine/tyrosine aminotransferase